MSTRTSPVDRSNRASRKELPKSVTGHAAVPSNRNRCIAPSLFNFNCCLVRVHLSRKRPLRDALSDATLLKLLGDHLPNGSGVDLVVDSLFDEEVVE